MRKFLLLSTLLVGVACAQATFEDFGCSAITGATNANPTVLTCNSAQSFPAGATYWVNIYGATGSWKPINTQWKTNVLKSMQAADTTVTVSEPWPQEVGGTMTTPFCNTPPCSAEGNATVTAINGNVFTITRSNPQFHYGTDRFFSLGSTAASVFLNAHRPQKYVATVIDSTHISIPVDATSFGAWSGTATIRRVNGAFQRYPGDYVGANNNPGLYSTISSGSMTETMPSITNPNDVTQAVAVRSGAGGFIVTTIYAQSNQLTVAGGVATLNFAPSAGSASSYSYPYQADGDRALVVGGVVWLDGWNDDRLEDAFLVTGLIGGSSAPTGITFNAPAGLADGTYGISVGSAAAGARVPARGIPSIDRPVASSDGNSYDYPATVPATNGGYMHGYTRSATWDESTNRFCTWLKMSGGGMQRRSNDGYTGTWGTYTKIPGIGNLTTQYDSHWYHYDNLNLYDGVWIYGCINNHPDHNVDGGTWGYPNDATYSGFIGFSYLGDSIGGHAHYLTEMGRIYKDFALKTRNDFLGASWSMGPITTSTVANEPDDAAWSLYAMWSPARYTQVTGCAGVGDAGQPACTGAAGGGAGYELHWTAPAYDKLTFEVRRSTSDMKVSGFSAGLCNDGSATCSAANGDLITRDPVVTGYNQKMWASSIAPSQASQMYFGIRPIFTVNYVSGSGASPIWIGSHTPFDMATGDHVTVSGVGGNTAANQTDVAIVDQKPMQNWWLFDPVGVLVCSMTNTSPIRITTCSPHGISNGVTVKVDANQHSVAGNTAATGTWVASVIDSTTIDLVGSAGNGTYNLNPYARVHGPGNLVKIDCGASASPSLATGNCQVTTVAAHGMLAGMQFLVAGSTNSTLGPIPQNTETMRMVATVPTTTTFTFACAGCPDGTYTADASLTSPLSIRTDPAIAISGTGNAGWTSGGTLVSTENTKNFSEILLTPFPTGPQLTVSPASLTYAYTIGGNSPATQAVAVGVTGTTLDNRNCSTATAWLSLSGCAASTAGDVTAGILTAGLTTGSYSGTISITSTTSGITNSPLSVPVSLTVYAAPSVATSSLPAAALAQAYSRQISVTGGQLPYLCSIAVGNLPSGLTIANNALGCLVSGTPDTWTGAASGFTVVVTDAGGATATKSLAVLVTTSLALSPPTISLSCVAGQVVSGSASVSAAGAVGYAWTLSGNQAWLSASPATGTGVGGSTVSANCGALGAGSYSGTVTGASSSTGVTGAPTIAVSLTVTPPPTGTTLRGLTAAGAGVR